MHLALSLYHVLHGIDLFVKHQPKLAPHISSYTNTDIVSQLKDKLTPDQFQQFGNTCFGSFLQMKRFDVQHQLFRCFMARKLNGTPNNVFAVYVNGTKLHFTLREFALVTGLKCVGKDEDFEFSETPPNRLIATYFGSSNIVKKKHLRQCFNDKAWGPDNDEDALKISLLYFIHTFIFSSEKNSATIPRLDFDLVESGRYSEYHWGIKAFELLINSISKKMDALKKYYRIAGMPLAMQVWFYECCSSVDSKIAVRVCDVVPRILNWRTTGNQPTFSYLMNGMFKDTGNTIVFKDITPLDIELVVFHIPQVCADIEKIPTPAHSDKSGQDTDDFSPTPNLQSKKKHVESVGPSLSLPHKKVKEQPKIPTKEPEYQPKVPPVCLSDIGHKVVHDHQLPEGQNEDPSSLRKDLKSFKEYVVGEFKSLRTLINDNFKMLSDQLQQNQQTEPIVRHDGGIDTDVGDNNEKTISEVPSIIPSTTNQEDVSKEFYVSQFELDDKFLPSQIPETRIVVHASAKKDEATPVQPQRNRRPSRWNSSPYQSNFDSGACSSVKLTPIFEKRHPFEEDPITGPHPMLLIQQYDKWVREGLLARHDQKGNLDDHYKKNKSILHIPLDFGVDQVDSKNWFYLLSIYGKLWDDNLNSTVSTRCPDLYSIVLQCIPPKYEDTDSNANVAKQEDVVCEYIRGYRLHANVPWHTVDNVLIPVNLKEKLHWVLVVVTFKDRCIKVYDSYTSSGHDAYVVSEIVKLAKLLPLYLSISGFYRDSQGIHWYAYPAYTNKDHNEPFEVIFVPNLPQQKAGSMDCGVHVAAFAEFLSTIGEITQKTPFYVTLLRQRYGALLWDYAMRKIDADAISESEAPSKIERQISDSEAKMQIVLE
ncbi:uncharacterized protein LOC107793773 [Nicotiana tabacum]|uniref:Uncharacterized protein LOC107793773 n=1 Tax=Nicotiana tabacum TaxID=4097 RepID=A0AC58TGE4_TOBAC